MQARKILSCFLALLMLLGSVTLFSSCGKKDDFGVVFSRGKVDVDLTGYRVVYPDFSLDGQAASTHFVNKVSILVTKLRTATGIAFAAPEQENATASTASDPEILVGKTTREQSVKALEEIDGHGFVIRVIDNKIVIVGTTNTLTLHALDYFVNNFLTGDGSSSVISVNKKVTAENVEMVTLINDGEADFTFIYQDGIDDKAGNEYSGEDKANFDYPYVALTDIRDKMMSITGNRSSKAFTIKSDAEEVTGNKIMVGGVNDADMVALKSGLAVTRYGIYIKSGKVLLAAWNDTTLQLCVSLFNDILTDATVVDADGNVDVLLPVNYSTEGLVSAKWVTDFPRPEGEGISLYGTTDVQDNSVLFTYKGAGVTSASYLSYCQALESGGYKLLTDSSAEDSIFRTYVNELKGNTLYVAYAAYKYADEYAKEIIAEPCIRITSAPLNSVTLPDENMLNSNKLNSYEKKTDSLIASMQLDRAAGNWGLSNIIVLEDGSFIIFDGGGRGENIDDHHYLWDTLTALYTNIHGQAPSKASPIHVAAWVLTHDHQDHYGVMHETISYYGSTGRLKIDYLIANFSSRTETFNSVNPGFTTYNNIANLQAKVPGGFKYIKVHTGQKFYFANAEMEVLYTHEDMQPNAMNFFNDTSTVVRVSLQATDGNGNKQGAPVTSVWLGDLCKRGSQTMCAMYGDYLSSDMVQLAHHGYHGAETDLYALVAPEIVWWPADADEFKVQTAGNSNRWWYKVDHYVAQQLASVKYIVVADKYDFVLPITANGPDFDNAYDLHNKKEIVYDNCNLIKK